jgi:hypothetical protein
MIIQAMRKLVKPIVTVKINMALRLFDSIAFMISWLYEALERLSENGEECD